jgi:hypothetical protein
MVISTPASTEDAGSRPTRVVFPSPKAWLFVCVKIIKEIIIMGFLTLNSLEEIMINYYHCYYHLEEFVFSKGFFSSHQA